jgi:Concanavalin A-like lectin/glucanases superfamily/Carboxypeptidase regulatory-like domain
MIMKHTCLYLKFFIALFLLMSSFVGWGQNACFPAQLPGTLSNGLVAFYPFCGDAQDKSGNALNGTVNNVTFGPDRHGVANRAGVFRKANSSYIEIPASIQFQPSSYTLSVWFNTTVIQSGSLGGNTEQAIVAYGPSSWLKGPAYKMYLDIVNNSRVVSRQWTSQSSWQDIQTPFNYVQINHWYHIVTTYEASTQNHSFYINGKLYGSRSSLLRYDGQISFTIGTSRETNTGVFNNFFDGSIDDVAFWNRVLTPQEISQLYTSSCTVPNFNPFQDSTIVLTDSVDLNPGAGYASYQWNDGTTTPKKTVKSTGKYSVVVRDANGCVGMDSVYVTMLDGGIIKTDTTVCMGAEIKLEAKRSLSEFGGGAVIQSNLKNKLIAWYPLDGHARDLSPNANHGTLFSGPVPTQDRFGNLQGAYYFNGSSGHMQANHLDVHNTLPFTVSCWMRSEGSVKASSLIGKYHAASWTGWQLSMNNWDSGRVDPWYINGPSNNVMGDYGNPPFFADKLFDGIWHHIVFSVDSIAGDIYVDGILRDRQFWKGTPQKTTSNFPLSIGWYPPISNSTQGEFKGDIDEVLLFSKALDRLEILQLIKPARRYRWSTGDTSYSIVVRPSQTTKYYLTTIDGPYARVDSVTVVVQPNNLGALDILPTSVYSKLDSLKLDPGTGYKQYFWSTGDTARSIHVKYTGRYKVTVMNASGCTGSDSVFVQFPDTIGVHVSMIEGICNRQVDVPIKATNFRHMLTMQGSIQWNATDMRLDSISGYGPAVLGMNAGNFEVSQSSNGRLTFSWNDALGNGISLADSTTIFTLRFTLLANSTRSIPLTITDTPTRLEFYDAGLVRKSTTLTPGAVSVICEFTINGKVLTPTDKGVKNVTVTLSGGTSNMRATTDSTGSYSFKIPPGTFTLSPVKTLEQNKLNGVSTLDLALLQSHVLQKTPFNAVYKVIAGDANNSSGVTTADILFLRRLLLGVDTSLPNNRIWAFVDGDQTFVNPLSPFPFNSTKTITTQSANISHTFRGIKIGDVNYDRNPLLDQAPSGDTLRLFSVWSDTGDGLLTMKLKSRAVDGLLGWQSTLRWDVKQLQLQNVRGHINNLGIGERWKKDGFVTLSWNDPMAEGLNLTEGVEWLEMTFRKMTDFFHPALIISEDKLNSEAFNSHFQSMGLLMEPAVPVSNLMKEPLRVYPNPMTSNMNVEWKMERAGTAVIRLIDAQGRLVHIHRGLYPAGFNRLIIKRSMLSMVSGHCTVQLFVDGRISNASVLIIGQEPIP